MHEMLFEGGFWLSVAQIIAIDILLGGDNAVVIALACRHLPDELRRRGIFWGVVGAIVLRIALIFFALQLLALPFLKIAGALLLLWIGVKLLRPPAGGGHDGIHGSSGLFGAIRTIVVADAVMSVDNVIAVAGAAHGNLVLVVFGIVVSVPVIVWGSRVVLAVMDRFPWVVMLGAALLGWIAGGMFVGDVAFGNRLRSGPFVHYAACALGAALVVALAGIDRRRLSRASDAA